MGFFSKKKKDPTVPDLDVLKFEDGFTMMVPTGHRPSQAELERGARNGGSGEGPDAGFYNYAVLPYDEDIIDESERQWMAQFSRGQQQQGTPPQSQRGSHQSGSRIGGTQRNMGGYQTDQPGFFAQRNGRGAGLPNMNPNALNGPPRSSRGNPSGGGGGSIQIGGSRQRSARGSRSGSTQHQGGSGQRSSRRTH